MSDKAVVLLSGGLDSSILLAGIVHSWGSENVVALNMFYGQKHAKEQQCAEKQAELYGVQLINLDLSNVFSYATNNPMLSNCNDAVPEKSYAEQLEENGGGIVRTYVPFRNGLFLSIAASVAMQVAGEGQHATIYYGAHADDAAGGAYPDCTENFVDCMDGAIYEGTGGYVSIEAPYRGVNKATIVAEGIRTGAHMEHTWSCYNGQEEPCGVCGTCIDRAKAFEANGIKDPAIK